MWITTDCGKFLKRWEYQTTLSASWEACMQDKKQQLEPDMEQWTGSKLGKEYVKSVYCHSVYLTYMQITSLGMPSWKKHKLESRLQGENTKPWRTPFPILNQSIVPCPVLTVASWPACRFLRRQVRWSSILISWRAFTVCCDPHSHRLWHNQ